MVDISNDDGIRRKTGASYQENFECTRKTKLLHTRSKRISVKRIQKTGIGFGIIYPDTCIFASVKELTFRIKATEKQTNRRTFMLLRKIRIAVAILFFTGITLLFLDFTGTLHHWFGWMAKIQFIPALLALNFGVAGALILLTLLLGRVYCSVICPLGVFQDCVSRIAAKRKKNRFRYSPALKYVRLGVLGLFILAVIAGIGPVVALLEPYSAYGRMASGLFAPVWQVGNNLLAYLAERAGSYAFYTTDIWIKSVGTLAVASVTFVVIAVLAWRGGRTYCNTVCPVGTILGYLSKFAYYKPRIDTAKCNGCGLCARNCKASCIDPKAHQIDYSRCVSCFDCIDKCNRQAIRYERRPSRTEKELESTPAIQQTSGQSRRSFLTLSALAASAAILKAQKKKADGGLAFIRDKEIPERSTPIVPPGGVSVRHFTRHCTGCQLCVSACPNRVLRPSSKLESFMQPEVSYERGYCRPECTKCSEVCPAGAFHPVGKAEKSSIQVGHAVWIRKNCIVLTDEVSCGNCARHCPTGAIRMVPSEPDNPDSRQIPAVDSQRCIGCGACENLCPARPFSAIYVEGHLMHKTI